MTSKEGCVFQNSKNSCSAKNIKDIEDFKHTNHAVIVTSAGLSSRFNNLANSLENSFEKFAEDSAEEFAESSAENVAKGAFTSCEFSNKNEKSSYIKKEFLKIDGVSVLAKAVKPFLEIPNLKAVVVTYNKKFKQETIDSLKCLENSTSAQSSNGSKNSNIIENSNTVGDSSTVDVSDSVMMSGTVPFYFVEGGKTRQESVFNALSFLMGKKQEGLDISLVSIHDACRPFVTTKIIEDCLRKAYLYGGAAPSVPINDTLVKISNGFVSDTIDRTGVYCIQTPQTFLFTPIYEAHTKAHDFSSFSYTDDSSLFLHYCHCQGFEVAMVSGSLTNRKITFKEDMEVLL